MRIDLQTLLSVNPDLSIYQRQPGDEKTPAQISVADLKEILLAINGSSRRIHDLYQDLQRAEARIEVLEDILSVTS